MTALFITILNMSISASIVVLAVMLVRIPLKIAPIFFSFILWGVLLVQLICPISFESPFGLIPFRGNLIQQDIMYVQNLAAPTGIQIVDTPINTAISNAPPIVNSDNISPINTVFMIASCICLLGFITLLLYSTIGYIQLKRRVYYATLVRDNIYETDKIKTPFVLGFISPKKYMPLGIETSQHDYILMYEQTHIKRRDYLIKPLAFIILALHWFNPLMWMAYLLMAKDMEMSCDESVLRKSNEDIRGVYSTSLLNLSVKRPGILSPLAFGESNVKSRIKYILNFKKSVLWLSIVMILVVIISSILFSAKGNILERSEILGISATNIEKDARASQQIENTWGVYKSVNNELCSMIFYNDSLDKHFFLYILMKMVYHLGTFSVQVVQALL